MGQIDYVFSDKTGTLTDNSLDFRKCVIGNQNYGHDETKLFVLLNEEEEQQQIEYEEQNGQGDDVPFSIQRAYTSDIGVVLEK